MRFFFHFNKPASASQGKPVISVHFNKKCYLVDNIVCSVNTRGKINKKQPVFVMTGKAESIDIIDNVAYLY